MKKNNKDHLYQTVFKLLLSKQSKYVTLKDIEEASGMTRGAVFYYASNKNALFREIVDTYFFKSKNIEDKIRILHDENIMGKSLHEFLHCYIQFIDSKMKEMEHILNMNRAEASKAYLSFILDAHNYYPAFNDKLKEIYDADLSIWEKVLANAQERGEIKEYIDTQRYAHIFQYFYVGLCYQTSLTEQSVDISEMEMYFSSIYMQIKK